MSRKLTPDKIQKRLQKLDNDWKIEENEKISRDFTFKNFNGAMEFVNKVAGTAENHNHHPDIFLHDWKMVRIDLSTHSVGGLSEKDFEVAREIEEIEMGKN